MLQIINIYIITLETCMFVITVKTCTFIITVETYICLNNWNICLSLQVEHVCFKNLPHHFRSLGSGIVVF